MTKIKAFAGKALKVFLKTFPWIILIALGVHFSSQYVADQIYKEFSEPFITTKLQN
jgi:hypothetical protein